MYCPKSGIDDMALICHGRLVGLKQGRRSFVRLLLFAIENTTVFGGRYNETDWPSAFARP
jgi:hypothetical protein